MIYGYARVSTREQSLTEQVNKLKESGVPPENVFAEKYTGTKIKRPKFTELYNKLEAGDTLIVTKLDRLARNTREALNTIDELRSKGIAINVLNMGKIEDTPVGKLIYTVLVAVAELERDMIVERTQEGKVFAKANNPDYKEGKPKRKLTPKYRHAVELLDTNSYKEVSKKTGISVSTLQRIKKQAEAEGVLS